MKKKLMNHGVEIANSIGEHSGFDGVHQYIKDCRYFVSDGYRILETESEIDALDLKTDSKMVDGMMRFVEFINNWDLDYKLHELPTVEKLKEGIRRTVGRKHDPVAWSDGEICVNARYLYKAMAALNATVCYVSSTKANQPIFLFEEDDLNSMNREIIMPVFNKNGFVGFWWMTN